MKGANSHSCVIPVRELLSTYNLPTIFDLIDNIPSQRGMEEVGELQCHKPLD